SHLKEVAWFVNQISGAVHCLVTASSCPNPTNHSHHPTDFRKNRTSMLPTRTLPGGRTTRQALPLGPNNLPLCRWCDLEILAKRRRTFCSDYCVHQWRLRTDPGYLRDQVFARDHGICAVCHIDTIAAYNALKRARGPARAAGLRLYGMKSITTRRSLWDADHIRPVAEGGGQCDLDNLRTLCLLCHREATAQLRTRLTGHSRAGRATLTR